MLTIQIDAKKQMIEYGYGRRFDDLNYFEGGFFFIP
jgi:hypothetical protein